MVPSAWSCLSIRTRRSYWSVAGIIALSFQKARVGKCRRARAWDIYSCRHLLNRWISRSARSTRARGGTYVPSERSCTKSPMSRSLTMWLCFCPDGTSFGTPSTSFRTASAKLKSIRDYFAMTVTHSKLRALESLLSYQSRVLRTSGTTT